MPIISTTPTFKKMLRGITSGEVIVPVLRAALYDPAFKGYTIEVEGFKTRPYDGWFHPSTHPTWPERQLWYYVHHPESLRMLPFDPASTMAVTQGHFWHNLIEALGLEIGFLRDPGICACGCGKKEWFVKDEETKSRGHIDGILNSDVLSIPEDAVFELKTATPLKAYKLVQGPSDSPEVVASFRKLWPEYYAQAQEYMRISGRRGWRGLVLSMGYPFEMREVALEYDYPFAQDIKTKYLRVRESKSLPLACCSPGSKIAKGCIARGICPVGRM